MSNQQNDRIVPGQRWTGKSGYGPEIVIKWIDLGTGEVHAERVNDSTHPHYTLDLNNLCANYRLM